MDGLNPLLSEWSLSLCLTSDSEMIGFLPLLIPFFGAGEGVEFWSSRTGWTELAWDCESAGGSKTYLDVESSRDWECSEGAYSFASIELHNSEIVTEGLFLGREKMKQVPDEEEVRWVHAGDLRNWVAHSFEESLSSNKVKKSIHSEGMETKGNPWSLLEKYLAHKQRAGDLGIKVLALLATSKPAQL